MVDKRHAAPESTREGGREEPKAPTEDLSGGRLRPIRNSSGEASAAANMLDIRQKVNFCLEMLQAFADVFGDDEIKRQIKQYRQQGFRTVRGPYR